MMENIYVSLDEAREEIKKRWNDVELRKKVEEELGDNFWSEFKLKPRGLILKNLISPENGLVFFMQCSKYIDITPLAFECLGDVFVSLNEEKKGMGRLHVQLENKKRVVLDIINFHLWEKKKFSEIITKTEESLVDFHHKLINYSGYNIEIKDKTDWIIKKNKPSDWYYLYLLHFIAHGVLFDVFQTEEDEKEDVFTKNIVLPALEKIEEKFGKKPLIVRSYPSNQSAEEDFYWWSFPPDVNNYIIDYANKHNLNFKEVLFKNE